jgi:hypothetical protein
LQPDFALFVCGFPDNPPEEPEAFQYTQKGEARLFRNLAQRHREAQAKRRRLIQAASQP